MAVEFTDCINVNLVAQLAEAAEYTDCISAEGQEPPHNECPGFDAKQWGSINAGPLRNLECPFITITPMSTLAQTDSTW